MTEVKFYEQVHDRLLKFAVIISETEGKWVFCKHKDRDTYEAPGGHREAGESIFETGERELREETGAVQFTMEPVCVYSVQVTEENGNRGEESFGMLFAAHIMTFEKELHSEIEKILITDCLPDNWTYPLIQPRLLREAAVRGRITVPVVVNRPLGSRHPKYENICYTLNYGYVEGIIAPDEEAQDVYILGVDVPVKEFSGRVIAVIHRLDDVEDKWVVASEEAKYTKEEIESLVYFQERYFKSEVRMV